MKTIALLLLSVCIASAVPGDAEWKSQNKLAWDQIKIEFAPFWGLKECLRIVREWDKVALKEKWPVYNDAWKPLYYLRWENAHRIEAEKAAEAKRIEAASYAAGWAAYVESKAPKKDAGREILDKIEEIRVQQEAENLRRFIERNN
jgi:hypothetical protein